MTACACGCGQPTRIRRGCPQRFVNGHNTRKRTDAVAADHGYTTLCLDYQGTINTEGYGVVRINYVQHKAHRLAWMGRHGEIPEGLTIDHLCRNKRCVNPDHMEPVTFAENARRMQAARKEAAR